MGVKDITDEINFDLPNGWEYVRLFSLGVLGGGYTPKQDELNPHGLVPYFKVADMNSAGNEKYLRYTNNYLAFKPKKVFPSNSIVFPKNGGAVFTNKKRILTTDSVVDLNTGVFTPTTLINFDYAYLIFSTIDFREYYKGTALPTINNEFMRSIIFGLPPLAEQVRIVAEIEKFEPLIAEYDKLEQQATKLDKEIYDKLKKSILQYAIQGKLVPQDPNDEPASMLLERIRAEKKAKLGKKYVDSYIYKGDDNCYYEKVETNEPVRLDYLPFDIPNSWSWVRLENAVIINPRNDLPDNLEVSFVEMKAISDGYNNHFSATTRPWKEVKSGFTHFQDGDVGFAKITPCFQNRKSVVFLGLQNGYGAGTTELHILRSIQGTILPKYLLCFVKSQYLIEYGKQKFSGTAGQQRFGTDEVKKTLLPLPPLTEQERIVKQVEIILEKLKDGD